MLNGGSFNIPLNGASLAGAWTVVINFKFTSLPTPTRQHLWSFSDSTNQSFIGVFTDSS